MTALQWQENSGFWAAGDCAAVPDGTGKFYPPTAQHGMREAVVAAKNIAHAIAGEPLKPFRYKTIGMLASLGHHTGVAMLCGMKFSGFERGGCGAAFTWQSFQAWPKSFASRWVGHWTSSSAGRSSRRLPHATSKLRRSK